MSRAQQLLIALTSLLSIAAVAPADDWTLTDAQLHTSPLQLVSIGADGLTVDNGPAISWQNVLELSRSTPATIAPDPYELYLVGGDRVGGTPGGVTGEKLQWKNSTLGELNFPLDRVAAVVRGQAPPDKLAENRTDDVVLLANGDVTHGIVSDVGGQGVTLQSGDATATLAWNSITAVLFSTTPPAPSSNRMFRVHLTDGSAVSIPGIAMAGMQVTLTLDNQTTRAVDAAAVTSIEQLNGPIDWLTDREPSENVYKPFFDESYPTRFDRTVEDDKPITQKYPGFHHGIGCHSYSRISYALDGQYAAFRTQFAIDSDSSLAEVTVRILLDGKPAFEEKSVKAGQIYPLVTIPLKGAKMISLEVDYGQTYSTQGRFVWLDPALVRTLP